MIATARAAERRQQRDRDGEAARRAGMRHVLVRATLAIMQRDGVDELAALKELRGVAMRERVALEDAAALYMSARDAGQARRNS